MKKTSSSKKKPIKVSSTLNLAQHLGLSEWTVSRAINGHPEVKAATRERILKAMKEVGFRPNPVARGLSGKAMGIVGVCFASARSSLMMDKITFLDEFLREHQLRGILAISHPEPEIQLRILADFKHLRVDGVILIQSSISAAELHKTLEGVRCVYVDPYPRDIEPSVQVDRHKAMLLVIDHLFNLGHRSFATLGFSSTEVWRWPGVTEALRNHGLNPEHHLQAFELETAGDQSFAEGIQLAQLACRAERRPTAYVALNALIAAGAIQEMSDRGLRIPQDISVVGFNNLDMGRYLRPRLTTIDQQPQLLMRLAGEHLLCQLGLMPNSKLENRAVVEPFLVVRDSTGPAPSTP